MSQSETVDHHDRSEDALRTEALESVLIEKGLVDPQEMERILADIKNDLGPMKGARVVARAWIDPDFKERLLSDGLGGVEELGLGRLHTKRFQVVENSTDVHNVVVCTLCSCYPGELLGKSPAWYKSPEYRARVVREPRAVLREFGLELDESIEIRVWDSTAELRYMVLPERPEGTDGMSEEELIGVVTRDSMVGVAKIDPPES